MSYRKSKAATMTLHLYMVLNRFPRIASALFGSRCVLFVVFLAMMAYGAPPAIQRAQQDRSIESVQQQLSDHLFEAQDKQREFSELSKTVADMALRTESRMSTVEAVENTNNRLLYIIATAVLIQIIETIFSYARMTSAKRPFRMDD